MLATMNIFFPPSVIFFLCVEALAFQGAAADENYLVPPAKLESAPYPEWAHYHWYCSLLVYCRVLYSSIVELTS